MTRPPDIVAAAGFRFLVWSWRGPAEPLVLLHGFAGRGDDFAPVVAELAPSRTVVAANLPGHDRLTPVAPERGFAGVVGDLAAAFEALSLRDIHIAGYSLGARVALALLLERPRLFRRGSLIGVNPGLSSDAERSERAQSDARWAELLRREGMAEFLRQWEAQPLFASQADLPAGVREAQRARRLVLDPRQLASALETLSLAAMPDFWPRLAGLEVPVQLVAGERDGKFRAIAEAALQLAPRSELHVVRGAGHNVVLERPGELAALLDAS